MLEGLNVEIKLSCPLGHQCETVKDGAIHRCAWYVQLRGNHPQTGAEVDEWGCAMAWTPVLLVENARTNRGQTAAIESFRNAVVQDNSALLGIISTKAMQHG